MDENKRPPLNKDLDGETFKKWYWLKEELVAFCKKNGIPYSGSKKQLNERIICFLDKKEIIKPEPKKKRSADNRSEITLQSVIEDGFVCTENRRAFFKQQIGKSFTFNVAFQKWLKQNPGKTYAQAIEAYHRIKKDRKEKSIDSQFEYNTYIRDFFKDNKNRSLAEAIKCWKYRKSQPGDNRYDRSDLKILEKK